LAVARAMVIDFMAWVLFLVASDCGRWR
jgi:hypothetical protein